MISKENEDKIIAIVVDQATRINTLLDCLRVIADMSRSGNTAVPQMKAILKEMRREGEEQKTDHANNDQKSTIGQER